MSKGHAPEKRSDGGPAFPNSVYPPSDQGGMSLRDYFAAGVAAAAYENSNLASLQWADLAANAYKLADAMLAEREKEKP